MCTPKAIHVLIPGYMSVMIVAAHPDDEVIGLATALPNLREPLTLVHITDGAPRSGNDPRNAGCATWKEYAALRRAEVECAMEAAGVEYLSRFAMDCPDQEATFCIAQNATLLAEILKEIGPAFIFTHAYEGGHPDHDATSATVHAALKLLNWPCTLLEFTSYHMGPNGFECECFLDGGPDVWLRPLNEEERRWKRDVLDRYRSQREVLAQFPLNNEPIRLAPHYDFSRSPQPRSLYYEMFNWGVDGHTWRQEAREAFRDLGISCVC
jgi:LmbE family N-acetylglucosaminyl deacetylase